MRNNLATRMSFLCLALLLTARSLSAQTTGYRTNKLAADQTGAPSISPTLLNPWGIAFLAGGNFLIAENGSGRVDSYDAAGNTTFGIPIPPPPGAADAFSRPTGIAAVSEPNIGPLGSSFEFLAAADNGTIWGFSAADQAPPVASRFVDNSATGASYTGIAFVHPDCCGPFVAVANFGQGNVDTFTRFGDPLSLSPLTPNPFIDPNLPAAYAPFNIQLIGNQLFVTYALRDSIGRPLLTGSGGGLVDIFDTLGNFVKRFASPGGSLNAPWGITQASANFGPFSNDILVANDGGDGSISAFNPNTGEFAGHLLDGTGAPLSFAGMHALAFRADGIGDPNALYNADAAAGGATAHGSFGTIIAGIATGVILNFFDTTLRAAALPGDPITLTAGVPDGATGAVVFVDTCCSLLSQNLSRTILGTANLVNGAALITVPFSGGDHVITANYSGDTNFGPGSTSELLSVLLETRTTLLAPSSVAAGMPVELSVNVNPALPSRITSVPGEVTFLDGTVNLGVIALNNGAAQLTVGSLATGTHTIVATFSPGSRFFQSNQSAPATVTVGNPVPAITSLLPFAARQNSAGFVLTVRGSGFVNGAVLTFNGSPRATTFVSDTRITAVIADSDLSASGTASIAVSNPSPGGGNSGAALLAIDTATSATVTLGSPSLTVVAGQSVRVTAQPTGFSGTLTAMCLNRPAGVTCSFDSASNSVTIQTAATTPKGAHVLTIVFSAQTLARSLSSPTLLASSLGILGLPLGGVFSRGKRRREKRKIAHLVLLLGALLLSMVGCGGYGGSKGMQPSSPQAQSAQASAALTLTVQ